MTTITTQSEIGPDGKLRLEVDCKLPPGPAQVTVVVEPVSRDVAAQSARSGLFVGKHLSEAEIDEALAEMNKAWKAKLGDLHP
jgi:hypothetical protein